MNIASLVGALGTRINDGFEACGSPGEVANDPNEGFLYTMLTTDITEGYEQGQMTDQFYSRANGKNMPWTVAALFGHDQLRQRVAWALAQIFVIGVEGVSKVTEVELFLVYYDIMVRNALGNYRDVLREVSYSPTMASYLTFLQTKSFAYSKAATGEEVWPDENCECRA